MNGKDISMVVDTGTGVSIINELTMQTLVTDNPTKLQPADHLTFIDQLHWTNYSCAGSVKCDDRIQGTISPGADRRGSGRNAQSARQKSADRVQVGLG